MHNQIAQEKCNHSYIIELGEDKIHGINYDYCLNCGKRIEQNFYHCIVLNATYYLEEFPIDTEQNRKIKMALIKERFQQIMLETGITKPEFIISDFKLEVEEKRNQMIKIGKKMLQQSVKINF